MKRSLSLLAMLFALQPGSALDWDAVDADKVMSGGAHLFKAAIGISDAGERKIGREVAANLAARYGLDEEPAKLSYLNLVGQIVVQHCGRTNIPYRFGILKSAEVNALAAPGGYVFVTQGLLDGVQSEAELAGILAHEVSHISQRHIVKAIRKANVMDAGVDFASAANKNAAQLAHVTGYSLQLLENGLSRKDELEADTMGTMLAAKSGYAADGLKHVLERLQSQDVSVLAHFNKTHPPAKDRLAAIEKILQKNTQSQTNAELRDRFISSGLRKTPVL